MGKQIFIFLLTFFCAGFLSAKTIKYPNGDVYKGKTEKKVPHGIGIMTYHNGNIYEGEWYYGFPCGKGKMTYENGNIFEGTWKVSSELSEINKSTIATYLSKNKSFINQGKMIWANGDYFEGSWSEELPFIGKGKIHDAYGNIYEGEIEEGKYHGEGIMILKNKNKYEGHWKKGKFAGRGKMIYNNGDIYEGEWRNNIKEGKGIMRYADGSTFDGRWIDNKRSYGKYTDTEYNTFNGSWKNDSIHSGVIHGVFINNYYDGDLQNGNLKSGVFKGRLYSTLDYEGTIKDFLPFDGNGRGFSVDKNFYDGKWVRGNFIGKCKISINKNKMKSFNGTISEDALCDGELVYDYGKFNGKLKRGYVKNGQGELHLSNDSIVVAGNWEEGNLSSGTGKLVCKDGIYKISINKEKNNSLKVSLLENNQVKNSKSLNTALSDSILIATINDLKFYIENKEQVAFYEKYLKNKSFAYLGPIEEYLYLPIGIELLRGIKIFHYLEFIDAKTVLVAKVAANMEFNNINRATFGPQASFIEEFTKSNKMTYKIIGGVIHVGDSKVKLTNSLDLVDENHVELKKVKNKNDLLNRTQRYLRIRF